MGSKDKSLPDRLKSMFKTNRGQLVSFPVRGEFVIGNDLLRDLGRDSPITIRTKILKDLSDKVAVNRLEDNIVEKLWNLIEDMFGREHSTETRHAAFSFLHNLIRGQSDNLREMRAQFFRFIKNHDHPEDVGQRLDLLNTLTSNGKYVVYFDLEIGQFLLNWFPDILKAGKIEEYLAMIDNVIKYNAAYLDEDIVTGFIQYICVLCCSTSNYKTVMSCLQIMATIVAYSNMSTESLPKFIGVLCRTVNIEDYCAPSWRIMKNLLGTHLGHSALYTMCKILEEPALWSDTDLLRGAVFFIHMALWGHTPLTNLHCPPSSVLPSFLKAVKCNQAAVAYEVILGLQHLVTNHGSILQDTAWTTLLEIISHIIQHIDLSSNNIPNKLIVSPLHETLNIIESLLDSGNYNCSVKKFFNVVEECWADRPDASILRLLSFLSQDIVPTEHLWLTNLYNLLHKYFKPEGRTSIRLKVLDILADVIKLNRRQYEDELIDRIVIPHMLNIVHSTDIIVRSSVARLLIDLCMECESKKCLEILDILERLLHRPFENHPPDNIPITESEHCDIKCLVAGLVGVFTYKIHKLPSSHAIKIYKMLVGFLEMHYGRPKIFENCPQVRYMIFDCFLKMRADSLYHLGFPEGPTLKFSLYLCVIYRSMDRGPLGSPPPQSPAVTQLPPCTVTYVSLRRAFKIFITCLKIERDWEVLSLVLREMTKGLQNKSLILSKNGNNELDLLVDVLCAMIMDRNMNLPESLNVKVSKPDLNALVLLVLVNLASYHNYLDQMHQQKMIRCLMKCTNTIGPRSSKHCIAALTTCTLEMREAMVKMLPEVLLNLSKISATVHIAIPVLEFLSTLTQLPMVFANFVADQYMAVFAISLPYTNPFKYNHYTVSLAHHVIAVWFLKCRLPFRKDFVRFITNSLQTNVLIPFEESKTMFQRQNLSDLNQDSSDRKRSSSLTEQGSRGRAAAVSSMRMDKPVLQRPSPDKSLMTFYEELTETCIDLMARYTFSPCSALPRRLPAAEFLLNGGQSMCWLIGNKLVTVTTSGCSQKVLKHGLCDKCWTLCNTHTESLKLKTARSGSNETEPDIGWASRQNSNEKSNNNTSVSSPMEEAKRIGDKLEMISSKLQKLDSTERREKESCACWCQGWAEIYVRRPTGDMSWVMRIQNQISYTHSMYEFPLNELSTLFMPSLYPEPTSDFRPPLRRQASSEEHPNTEDGKALSASNSSLPGSGSPKPSPSRQNSRDSAEEELEYFYDDGTKSRNPVRRSNSSPEMSASWKNPFLHQKTMLEGEENKGADEDNIKKNKMYSKDMRVSCEAIPEEIAGSGTTPPSYDALHPQKSFQPTVFTSSHHPSLLSCHSYPGSSPPNDPNIAAKSYQTVPPSPNVIPTGSQPDFQKRPNNLPNVSSLVPLSSKPPQSPTQTSPRPARHFSGHEIQKSSSSSILEKNTSNANLNLARERAKERKNSGSVERLTSLESNQAQKRDRVHTISVMSPANRKPRSEHVRQPTRSREVPRSGINPSFVFLQLYHATYFGHNTERPLIVGSSDVVQRAVNVLDLIPPYETHKIGVLYIREGQVNSEVEILRNRFGSLRYVDFLQNLGTLVKLSDVDPQVFFLGGLDQRGEHGKFAYIWQDDVIRVTFHVATMMPNKEYDTNCNNKKMHIGNNYVTIVYNESGEEFNINTIKGQFNFAAVIIQPLDHNTNRVVVKVKDELKELLGLSEPKIVSDQNVAILARQLALHANLASLVVSSLKSRSRDPYASNWLERLRKIKNIRNKILQEQKEEESTYPTEDPSTKNKRHMEDFTDYT